MTFLKKLLRHPQPEDGLRWTVYIRLFRAWNKTTEVYCDFKYFFKNVYYYRKLLATDRQWDSGYLYHWMEIKLRHMAEAFEGYRTCNFYTVNEKDIRRLRVCAELMRRIQNENYVDKLNERHQAKWGRPRLEKKIDSKGRRYGEFISHPKALGEDQKEQARKESKRIHEHGEYMFQQDLSYFSKLFQRYSRGWWD